MATIQDSDEYNNPVTAICVPTVVQILFSFVQIPKQVCFPVETQNCHDVPVEKCHDVPKQLNLGFFLKREIEKLKNYFERPNLIMQNRPISVILKI